MEFSLQLQEDFWSGKSDRSSQNRCAWSNQHQHRNFYTKARTRPFL